MDLSTWLFFISIALVTTFSPGPAVLLAVTNSLNYGLRATFYSTLGNEVGLLVIASLAVLGLGAVLTTSTTLFLIIKTIGAVYLIYLGIRQWRSNNKLFSADTPQSHTQTQSNGLSFLQGFLVATTNPKAILFFTALFPQFITLDKPLALQCSILIATFTFLSAIALMSYGFLAHRSKQWFSKRNFTSLFNRVFGGLFIAMGIGLLQLNHKN
ncbi:MAG TPA: LysE family translocator [Leucothrix mucor]|uniref:LysE family translocator n=1 Tax=Leucothrix mucor TaxID=45248 RepID=A0A7V2WU27_LEUMU|nr:LysE family translocator [Leucothrix mucor]